MSVVVSHPFSFSRVPEAPSAKINEDAAGAIRVNEPEHILNPSQSRTFPPKLALDGGQCQHSEPFMGIPASARATRPSCFLPTLKPC